MSENEAAEVAWAAIDDLEPKEGFSQIWVTQAYGYKFSKKNEYGMQLAFTRQPTSDQLDSVRRQMERFMRAEGIKGAIRYEYLTYFVADEDIPDE